MKHFSIPAWLFAIFCSVTVPAFTQPTNYNAITFVQEDSSKTVTLTADSITLDRKPFSIVYYGKRYNSQQEKYYAMQVAVLKDAADTSALGVGKSIAGIPYFGPGTGMAPGANGLYDIITVDNAAHHYLYYENEAERRVSRISIEYDLLELEWRISGVWLNDQEFTLAKFTLPALYFVFYDDRNLNEVIDPREIKIVKVNFR